MSNFNNPTWNNPQAGYPGQYAPGYQYPQAPLNTNIVYVTSPEEALMRSNIRNSDIVYFDQDKNMFYRVKVDMDGKKSWATFMFNLPDSSENAPATKADIQQLSDRITELEKSREFKASPKKKKSEQEVVDNGESDV